LFVSFLKRNVFISITSCLLSNHYPFCYINNEIIRVTAFAEPSLLLHLQWASLLRSAPFELPQGGNAARVEGCSGAIKVACPFFIFQIDYASNAQSSLQGIKQSEGA